MNSKSLLIEFLFSRWQARVVIFLVALSSAVFGVASPLFQKIFVDGLLGARSSGFLSGFAIEPITAIVIAFLCTLAAQVLGLISNFLCVREGTFLQRVVSERMYKKTLSIRPDSMGSTTVGEVVSLYATDVPGATALIDQVMPMATGIFFNLILAPIVVVMVCDIPLWATFIVMGGIALLTLTLATRQGRFFVRFKQLAAERTGIVNEWIQTIRLLRILGWVENFENKIFLKRIEETANRIAMVTNGQLMNAFGSSINFVINLTGVASLIFLSGRNPSPGELFALLWIFGVFLVRPFRQLPWFFTFVFDSMTSMRRLEAFLRRPSDAGDLDLANSDGARERTSPALSVAGLNLEVSGKSGSQKILSGISFEIKAGEFVAIVGEVGSGKSMLALSLVGETGAVFEQIHIGDVDAKRLKIHERRRYFSFVPQEGFVMSASLRENVAFAYDPSRDRDESILKSLEVAQFRLSNEMPEGDLDTEIGERGVNLSGGQRQRVSLARAHQYSRPIILLDDCLSAVDVDTEQNLLAKLIDGEWKLHTRILVTHRLSVLNQVDCVFFMEHGQIVERGPYKNLLESSERMRKFVESIQREEAASQSDAASETVVLEQEGGLSGEVEPLS